MNSFGILAAFICLPLLFIVPVLARPVKEARWIALAGTLVTLAAGLWSLSQFSWAQSERAQFESAFDWFPGLGLRASLGADGVSMALILLTLALGPICVGCSFTAINEREKTYYAWILALQAAMTGVFAAQDLVMFYVCFEFTLIPMFVLISLWGSTNRKKAAVKFFLYTFTGSVIALAGFAYVAYSYAAAHGGQWNFDLSALQKHSAGMPFGEQKWVLLALMAGFAVKIPLFPVHTWLPLAHTEAPTAGSVILAGVLLKLGTYGMYRFALPFAPEAIAAYAPMIAALCIIGILYGGLICWVQQDVKKLVAYSSVAHLGFCILGLLALNSAGIRGSVLYMINHGLSTGGLFLLIGMVYERYHTRDMRELGGLAARMPVWSTFMVFFAMASVGLPGTNGFVSEFMCLLGTFQAYPAWSSGVIAESKDLVPGATAGGVLGPWYAGIAGVGMVVAAMYLLMMVGKVVWGPLKEPAHEGAGGHGAGGHGAGHGAGHGVGHESHGHGDGGGHHHPLLPRDLSVREILVLVPMAAGCLWLGVYPKTALDAINPSVEETIRVVQGARLPAKAPAVVESGVGGGVGSGSKETAR